MTHANSANNQFEVELKFGDEIAAIDIERSQQVTRSVTLATLADNRKTNDKLVVGVLKKSDNSKIPIIMRNPIAPIAVINYFKEYLIQRGNSIYKEVPSWNQKEESIDKSWGNILIGGRIDNFEVSYAEINANVASFKMDVHMTFVLADVRQGKILDMIDGSGCTTAHIMLLDESKTKDAQNDDLLRKQIEQQISDTVFRAIKKACKEMDKHLNSQ